MPKDIVASDRSKFQVEVEGINVNLPVEIIKSLPLSGEVYLIKCREFYKIGASAQIRKRISSLQTAVPFDIELIDSFVSCDVFWDERRLHSLCSEFNIKNEWFALPNSFAKNRNNWFKPKASPIKQIREGMLEYTKWIERQIAPPNSYLFEFEALRDRSHSFEAFRDRNYSFEYPKTCFALNIEIDSQIIANRFNVDVTEVHNNRYRGLYRKNATQLREDAGLKKSETPLDRLSAYDLNLNSLANQMALMAGDSGKVLDAANGLRSLHEQTVGKPLTPTWEEKLLRPNQAKAIAYSPEYQTELPVA